MAFLPNGQLAFVTLRDLAEVAVIDTNPASTSFHTVIDTLETGPNPRGAVVTPDGQKLYVGNQGDNIVSVFTLW